MIVPVPEHTLGDILFLIEPVQKVHRAPGSAVVEQCVEMIRAAIAKYC